MLLSLPLELVGKIFSYHSIKNILQCATISKYFYDSIKCDEFWLSVENVNTKIYKSILENLTLMKRLQNIKIEKSVNFDVTHQSLGEHLVVEIVDDKYIVIYDDISYHGPYNAYIFDHELILIDTIRDKICTWYKYKYLIQAENKFYIKCHLDKSYLMPINVNNTFNVTMNDNCLICYNDDEFIINNFGTGIKHIENICNTMSAKIHGNDVAIITLNNGICTFLKYDLVEYKIAHRNVMNILLIPNKRIMISNYDGQYLGCYQDHKKDTIYIDTFTNSVILDGHNIREGIIYENKFIVDLWKDTITDIANLIGTYKINYMHDADGCFGDGVAIANNMIVAYVSINSETYDEVNQLRKMIF